MLLHLHKPPVRIIRHGRIMHPVREYRVQFFFFFFFFFLLFPVINDHGYFEAVFGRTFVSAFHGGAVGETAAYSETYVFVAHDTIIDGMQTKPSIERNIGYHPGMGGAFATELVVLGTEIATYITGR